MRLAEARRDVHGFTHNRRPTREDIRAQARAVAWVDRRLMHQRDHEDEDRAAIREIQRRLEARARGEVA